MNPMIAKLTSYLTDTVSIAAGTIKSEMALYKCLVHFIPELWRHRVERIFKMSFTNSTDNDMSKLFFFLIAYFFIITNTEI